MRRSAIIVIAALAVSLASLGHAQERAFKIIGHAGTTPDSVTKHDLARIFLKQKTKWPSGQTAEPVDQKGNGALQRAFAAEILDKTPAMVESYWQAQVFSGRDTPPVSLGSDAAVIDFVRSHPGAVGYVSRSASANGVKTITVTD